MARLVFFCFLFFLTIPMYALATTEKENDFMDDMPEQEKLEAMSEMLQLLYAEKKQEQTKMAESKQLLETALSNNDLSTVQVATDKIKKHELNITLLDQEIHRASKLRGSKRVVLASTNKSTSTTGGNIKSRSVATEDYSSLFDPGSVHHDLDTYARSKENLYVY